MDLDQSHPDHKDHYKWVTVLLFAGLASASGEPGKFNLVQPNSLSQQCDRQSVGHPRQTCVMGLHD